MQVAKVQTGRETLVYRCKKIAAEFRNLAHLHSELLDEKSQDLQKRVLRTVVLIVMINPIFTVGVVCIIAAFALQMTAVPVVSAVAAEGFAVTALYGVGVVFIALTGLFCWMGKRELDKLMAEVRRTLGLLKKNLRLLE